MRAPAVRAPAVAPWLLAVFVVALVTTACTGRPRGGGKESGGGIAKMLGDGDVAAVEIDLTSGAPQQLDGGGFIPVPVERTYYGLLATLRKIERSKATRVVFVRLGGYSFDLSRTEEVVAVLGSLRKSGKKVVCHAHGMDNASTWLMLAGCDRRWLSPAGGVDSVGLAGQVLYMKGALDRLSVHPDFISVGKFKSAAEGFTREGPSDAARKALMHVLTSLRKGWRDGVAASGVKGARDAVELGPYTPAEAKKMGFVDAVGFASEAKAEVKKLAGDVDAVKKRFGPRADDGEAEAVAQLIRALAGSDGRQADRPHVAVVPAIGAISMEGGGGFGSRGITASALNKTIRQLREDDSVKAVVLRIDSPGGSALASDLMWHELNLLRKEKPLVTSVGSMAASGGYYLACASNEIVAPKTSIVGSIGVLGGKFVIGDTLARVGVNVVTFPAADDPVKARRATYLSAANEWDEPTKERIRKSMESVYELFLERVAAGRKMKRDDVHAIAQGRIWSGTQGKGNKLVDHLGGLNVAIERARALAKLDEDAPVVLEGGAASFLEQLLVGDQASAAEVEQALAAARLRAAARLAPLGPELRAHAGHLAPFLSGERVLAMSPVLLQVR